MAAVAFHSLTVSASTDHWPSSAEIRAAIAAVHPERLGQVVGHLSHKEMAMVDKALRIVLGLN